MTLKVEQGGLFGERTLGLFECKVPEQDCNIQLGSRRKSVDPTKTEFITMNTFNEDSLLTGITALALHQLQNGRPDALLGPEIYKKVGELCKQIATNLLQSGTKSVARHLAASTCNKTLDSSNLEIAIDKPEERKIQSFDSSTLGTCATQEDRSIRVGRLTDMCGANRKFDVDYLVGVYDGHGGQQCSEYSVERIFYEIGVHTGDIEDAIRDSYKRVDASFYEASVKEDINAGCTALTCVLRDGVLWCGNVGDSRAVMCRKEGDEYIAKQLTTDQNVKNEEEVNAVIERGGTILRNRVNGVLCVTRALGNKPCRDLISQTPDIARYEVCYGKDQFLMLGSDGLYDKATNQELCDFVVKKRGEQDTKLAALRAEIASTTPEDSETLNMLGLVTDEPTPLSYEHAEQLLKCSYQTIADDLVEHVAAKTTGYCDNTTCVLLFFDCKDALTANEITLASTVVNNYLKCQQPEDSQEVSEMLVSPPPEESTDDFDPMESSMMTRPV